MSKFKLNTITAAMTALPVAMISGIGGAAVGVLGSASNSLLVPLLLLGGGGLVILLVMKKNNK